MVEVWKVVPDTNNIYWASDFGRIKRAAHIGKPSKKHPSGRPIAEKILKPTPTGDGHLQVGIFSKLQTVHSLVLLAFVGPRPPGIRHIRHLDDDPANNALGNIIYGTEKENATDREMAMKLSGAVRYSKERTDLIIGELKLKADWTYREMKKVGEMFGVSFCTVRRIRDTQLAHV